MSLVAISGNASGTGTLTIAAPNTNSNYTLTLPAATGTVMVSGNMPAFSAYLASAQSLTSGVFTKVALNTEEFDTNGNFDNATNYRFTPTVAGYYQISANVGIATTGNITTAIGSIYKNGARFKDGNFTSASSSGTGFYSVVSALIYFNGSTDYVELYGFATGTGTITLTVNSGTLSYFQGVLVRSA
jgi:gamma-glutamyl phosphate reductase